MLQTFPLGGIHPPENKLTKDKPIEQLPIPKIVYVPVAQHIGIPSEIVVDKKDVVTTGQLIAKASGKISAHIHSPVSGKVTKIDKIVDNSGYKQQCIVIKTDIKATEEAQINTDELITSIKLSPTQILERVQECGIVGLGGATFPSNVKLSINPDNPVDTLIVNGVECEPYLTADHVLMLHKSKEILVGIQILKKALDINYAIIGIENNKPNAIHIFEELTKNDDSIKVASLKVKYPQGGEKQLIKAVLNREVPKGGLPNQVGVVVHNVGTVFAIYEAVQYNKPLMERVVTLTGKNLNNASNFWVKIGTPVKDLLEAAGGIPNNTEKIINGGPMMGKALKNTDVPVTKGTSGILLMPDVEAHRPDVQACIRCGGCVSVCPMGLEPYLLMSLAEKNRIDTAIDNDLLTCIECGSCSYICPAHRPLLDFIRFGKKLYNQSKAS